MSGKLLNRTVRVYLLYSLVVMIVAAPLFYFLTDKLFIDDADEALLLRKNEFKTYHTSKLTREDVDKWNNFNRDIKIQPPDPSIVRDSIFYRFYVDTLANENEPYRVLLSPVTLDSAPYTLMVRINLVESEDMITNIATLFCAILGILLTGLYFITRRLSKTLWQPFYSTIEQIEKFEIDKNSPPYFSPDKVE
ncbi:MAG TPA: hypothetical protein VG737_17420, partial [Cyclobacteriaceae bacterium]|nr:hypothetical protein [Cyclobacteriaceae bacterium]